MTGTHPLSQMNRVVTEGEKESPPPQTRQAGDYGKKKRGRVAKTKGRNLWERFKEYEDGIFAFMTDQAIPFTNNQAERDIRMTRDHEKVSGGFRSPQGALPDFINLAEIPGELMEIVLSNALREDVESEKISGYNKLSG